MRCGRVMSIRVTANGPRRYVYFRCRAADADGAACTGTQVRAFDIEQTVRSVPMEPDRAFPRKRGRPTRATVALYSIGQVLPLLDPNGERELVRKVVQAVAWNALRVSGSRSTWRRWLRELRNPLGSLRVFVDLAPRIDGKHEKRIRFAVGREQDPPTADP